MNILTEYLAKKGLQGHGVMTDRTTDPVPGGVTNVTYWEAHWTFDGVEKASAYGKGSRMKARNAAAEDALKWLIDWLGA